MLRGHHIGHLADDGVSENVVLRGWDVHVGEAVLFGCLTALGSA
jgi:hypothetical protein